jgi:glycolate oxidase iron-sulfur subunit
MDSPRGRIYLMKALAEGRLDPDADVVRHLDLCLECRGCETACPSGVHYGRLIEKTRVYIERNWRRRFVERARNWIVGAIFPYPQRLRVLLAPLRLADRAGIGVTIRRWAPGALRDWVNLLPPADSTRNINRGPEPTNEDGPAVVVHHGCVAQVLTESENINSERMLKRAGYRVVGLEQTVCCGALDIHNGNIERALQFARANVRAMKDSGAQAIISAASGCSAVIAAYGELLKDDPEYASDANEVAKRATDLSTLLVARGNPAIQRFSAKVTYHDSCHLAHGMGIRETPRQLLKSIPGVELIEMTESDLCCGSAGSYNLTQPEMARQLAARKADNIEATGAQYVVLSNPGCEFQISAELRRRGSKVRVLHLADFLELASANVVQAKDSKLS